VTTTADDNPDVLAPLAALLRDHPAGPDDAVLHTPDGSLSLGELKAAAERVADALRASCVDAGSPVACIVDGGVSAIAVMFGTWLVGGVHVPLNGRSTDHELETALDALRPAAVVGTPRTLQTGVRWVVETAPQQWHASACFPWFGERLPESTALLMRTSGTTGEAKTIALSHEGVLEGIDRVLGNLRGGRSSGSRMPNLVPSSQALWAGVWNGLFALRAGSPVVLLDRFEPAAYAELVRRFEIRSTVLAPAMMAMLVADPGEVRRRGHELLRADRARQRGGRLDRCRPGSLRRGQARRGGTPALRGVVEGAHTGRPGSPCRRGRRDLGRLAVSEPLS
jgi:long-chain acyl-CoA synthetase